MINLYGPINSLGYGVYVSNMLKALIDNNNEVCLTTIGPIQNDPYFEPYWKTAEGKNRAYDAKSPSYFMFHDEFSNQCAGKPLAVLSMFETTRLKKKSINMLNNGPADIVITLTENHKQLLIENGIKKEIVVIPAGVDDCLYNTIPTDKHIDTKKFTYITAGKTESRKNTALIIETFCQLFGDKEVALIAHTFNPFANKQNVHPFKNLESWSSIDPQLYGFSYAGWDGKAHKFSKGNCDIYFTAPGIMVAEMACLYNSAHVGIQISKGEGWDLPAVEMLGCGRPCIISNCLGHREFIGNNNLPEVQKDLIIPIVGKEIANDGIWFDGSQGEWDVIDKDAFRSKLEETYKNKDIYLNPSEELGNFMANEYSWSKAASSLTKMLTNYTN